MTQNMISSDTLKEINSTASKGIMLDSLQVNSSNCTVLTNNYEKLGYVGMLLLPYIFYYGIFRLLKFKGFDKRTNNIFYLDISKIALVDIIYCSIYVSTLNNTANNNLNIIFTNFLNDFIFAVPISLMLWQLFTASIRFIYAFPSCDGCCIQSLFYSGRYFLENDTSIQKSWWFNQLLFWAISVLISLKISQGIRDINMGSSSPYIKLENSISALDWTCGTKLYVFIILLRLFGVFIRTMIIDNVNKYRKKSIQTVGLLESRQLDDPVIDNSFN